MLSTIRIIYPTVPLLCLTEPLRPPTECTKVLCLLSLLICAANIKATFSAVFLTCVSLGVCKYELQVLFGWRYLDEKQLRYIE